jgi:hypothetical protein
LTPDSNDKIYDIDAPFLSQYYATNCNQRFVNFHQWIEWNGVIASDGMPGTSAFPEAAEWHFSGEWQSNAIPQVFGLNLGGGYIGLPASASCSP